MTKLVHQITFQNLADENLMDYTFIYNDVLDYL